MGNLWIEFLTEIYFAVLATPDFGIAKVAVEHRAPLLDDGGEGVSCEDIALWIEQNWGGSCLSIMWNSACRHQRNIRKSVSGRRKEQSY